MHADFTGADVAARHVLVDPPEGPGEVMDTVLRRFADGAPRHSA